MRTLLMSLLALMGCFRPTVVYLAPQLSMTAPAWRMADSTYHAGWVARKERALCVDQYDTRPDGTVVVQRLVAPDTVIAADSVGIEYRCPRPMPVLHTHLIENGWRYRPSPTDSNSLRTRSAPFSILMSDSHAFTIWWKP